MYDAFMPQLNTGREVAVVVQVQKQLLLTGPRLYGILYLQNH